jgi:predicted MFS family arabinose efflux permease
MGEGAVLMVSMSVLARMASPDRAYAKVLLINNLFGIAISFLMQAISEWTHSPSVVFPLMLLLLLGLSSILLVMPESLRADGTRAVAASTIGHASLARVLVLTVAVMTVAACDNMVWSFFFPFGQHAGMNAGAVNRSLELAVLVSALGAAIPTILGARYGRLRPLALGLFVQMAAIVLMYRSSNSVWFSVAANFYLVGGFLAVPYYFGFAAAEDPSGRAAAIVGGSYTLAGAMSPLLGGVVIERFGLHFVPWIVIGANCFAVSVFWWLNRSLLPRARATDRAVRGGRV